MQHKIQNYITYGAEKEVQPIFNASVHCASVRVALSATLPVVIFATISSELNTATAVKKVLVVENKTKELFVLHIASEVYSSKHFLL